MLEDFDFVSHKLATLPLELSRRLALALLTSSASDLETLFSDLPVCDDTVASSSTSVASPVLSLDEAEDESEDELEVFATVYDPNLSQGCSLGWILCVEKRTSVTAQLRTRRIAYPYGPKCISYLKGVVKRQIEPRVTRFYFDTGDRLSGGLTASYYGKENFDVLIEHLISLKLTEDSF